MKRVFVDTNFIIDLVARPEFSDKARSVLELGKIRKLDFYICFLSLANYAYIDRKNDRLKLFDNLKALTKVFHVLPNDYIDIERAISINPKDFEDGIQYCSALKGKCDCIVTRNKKDFIEFSQITVLTPDEFLNQ